MKIEGIASFLIDHPRLIFSAVVSRDTPKADERNEDFVRRVEKLALLEQAD